MNVFVGAIGIGNVCNEISVQGAFLNRKVIGYVYNIYKTKPKNRTPVEEYAEPEETFGVVPLTDMDYNQETLDI